MRDLGGNAQGFVTISAALGSPALGSTTGTELSEIGSGRPLTASAALGQLKPAETDERMLACLERISGRRPVFKVRTMFPASGPTYRVIERVTWPCPAGCLDAAKAVVAGSLRSAPEATLAAALYRLRVLTRGRERRAEADLEAEATVWLEDLRCWPADVALETIRAWPTRNPWWPTWSEIEAEMRRACEVRAALAAHLRSGPPEPAAALPEPERPSLAELRERHGERWGIDPGPDPLERRPRAVPLSPDELCARAGVSREAFDAIPSRP